VIAFPTINVASFFDFNNCAERFGLFQRVVDRRKHIVEVGAETIHSDSDSDRDTGCDRSILNEQLVKVGALVPANLSLR